MCRFITLVFLLISSSCFCQRSAKTLLLDASNYKVKGYCDNIGLEALDARFITVKVNGYNNISIFDYYLDYGQERTKDRYNDLKDENHRYLEFTGLTVLLNFMSYNGWIYQNNQSIDTYTKNTSLTGSIRLFFYKEAK